MRGADRRQSEPGGEDTVEGGRRAAALDVAEDGRPGFVAGPLLDLSLQRVANTAEPRMAKLIEGVLSGDLDRPLLGRGPLGRDDDREIASPLVTAADQTAHLVDVERDLRNQDHIGAAGYT